MKMTEEERMEGLKALGLITVEIDELELEELRAGFMNPRNRGKKRATPEEEGELDWTGASEGDIVFYRIVMRSINRQRVPDRMRERLEDGAGVIEAALEEGYLPKWVLRKFERWCELWYGKGASYGLLKAKYGFPESILTWKDR